MTRASAERSGEPVDTRPQLYVANRVSVSDKGGMLDLLGTLFLGSAVAGAEQRGGPHRVTLCPQALHYDAETARVMRVSCSTLRFDCMPPRARVAGSARCMALLRRLGHGADGVVWLATVDDMHGRVFVVKDLREASSEVRERALEKERAGWGVGLQTLRGVAGGNDAAFYVDVVSFSRRAMLVMPFAPHAGRDDWSAEHEAAAKAAIEQFAAAGMKHTDMARRNVGFVCDASGGLHAVLLDLARYEMIDARDAAAVHAAAEDMERQLQADGVLGGAATAPAPQQPRGSNSGDDGSRSAGAGAGAGAGAAAGAGAGANPPPSE